MLYAHKHHQNYLVEFLYTLHIFVNIFYRYWYLFLKDYDLWVAEFNEKDLKLSKMIWGDWKIWQICNCVDSPLRKEKIDFNYFNGNEESIARFINNSIIRK